MKSESQKRTISAPPNVTCPPGQTDVTITVPAGSPPHYRLTLIQSEYGMCRVNSGGKVIIGPAVVIAHYSALKDGTTETLQAIDSDGEVMTFQVQDYGTGQHQNTSFVRVRAANDKGDEVEITVVMQDTSVPRGRTKKRGQQSVNSNAVDP